MNSLSDNQVIETNDQFNKEVTDYEELQSLLGQEVLIIWKDFSAAFPGENEDFTEHGIIQSWGKTEAEIEFNATADFVVIFADGAQCMFGKSDFENNVKIYVR